jgi:hypothetical protein
MRASAQAAGEAMRRPRRAVAPRSRASCAGGSPPLPSTPNGRPRSTRPGIDVLPATVGGQSRRAAQLHTVHNDQPDLNRPLPRSLNAKYADDMPQAILCSGAAGIGADLRPSCLVAHLWHTRVRNAVQPSQPASTNHARNGRSRAFQAGFDRSFNP